MKKCPAFGKTEKKNKQSFRTVGLKNIMEDN